eukprot:TRINITY_DN4954_c0_g1_i1.p1 TRINITY_DN4954_c0_g1~~TRINITY_DN4954_c0_g1_i1.p1  ORF type:complete len:108 (-),score=16.31 TRINITY_DN4954_c0_g1_i1:170-493(-)
MTKRKMAEAGSKPSTSKQRPGVFELFQGDGGEETSDNDSDFDLGNDSSVSDTSIVADSSEESDSSDSGESVRSTLNVSADNADETHTIEQRVYLASRKYMTIIGSVQ